MDTQNLKAFVAVAETASFSLAGERLHLTQPAVSKRIAALESQLQAPLFDRIGRMVSLTEAGRALLPRARAILQDVADTERAIQDLRGEVAGPLHLATSHHIGLHRLPPVLRRFSGAHPAVRLGIDFMDSEAATTAVVAGTVELAVVTLAPETDAHCHSQRLWRDPLTVVVAPEHPLAQTAALTLADLSRHPAILPELDTHTGRIVQRLFAANDLTLDLAMTTNYLETIKMLVGIGLGWSLLPHTLLDPSLRPLQLPDVALSRELGLIHHRDRTLSNAARAFIQALENAADPS